MVMFSKILTSIDINRRLSAPENCIRALPPAEKGQEMSLHVKDKETGVVWTFRCKIPEEGYSKPVIFGDWLQFTRTKDLRPGDWVTFHQDMDEATEAQYKIEAERNFPEHKQSNLAMAIFSKILTNSDVMRRLSIPENSIKAFPPAQKGHEIILHVKDDNGTVWKFRCRMPAIGFSKPVVFGNWFQFVRSKDLKPGDMIVFYKEMDEDNGAQYKIEVKKREPSYLGRYRWKSPAMDSESFHL
ncbi:hypothetical protein GH714_020152 [Hevea brasiliensis]|uniref:TF-B3 domain-containing protein n=1 Tax=Hevea brasiliensis TaxID=3981 RepID=A0A6A6N3K3_HEVBR|nr:hypothetical protein GH714_020152 [Hevea brasiliensis]